MKAAVLGYGNIGSGVVTILEENKDLIAKKAGKVIETKYVLDLREFPGDPHEDLLTHDVNDILNDPEIEIVVETMGGTKPAYEFVKRALLAGKHVATSNKALVAAHGSELLAIAAEKKINFFFEASVGGGIPIIRAINQCVTADDVDEITGIVNGTTNFMLTKIGTEGAGYDDVLKEAQALGFAERDPSADVEGYDAARKIAILCSLCYDRFVDFEDVHTEGITKITPEDFLYAKALGRTIKLFATGKKVGDQVSAMVAPKMIRTSHPLANINNEINAVLVRGDMIADLSFSGAGAGKLPTASAVVADVVEAARNCDRTVNRGWSAEKLELADFGEVEHAFFVRVSGCADCAAAEIAELFGDVEIVKLENLEEFAFLTAPMKEKVMAEKFAALSGAITRIRLED